LAEGLQTADYREQLESLSIGVRLDVIGGETL